MILDDMIIESQDGKISLTDPNGHDLWEGTQHLMCLDNCSSNSLLKIINKDTGQFRILTISQSIRPNQPVACNIIPKTISNVRDGVYYFQDQDKNLVKHDENHELTKIESDLDKTLDVKMIRQTDSYIVCITDEGIHYMRKGQKTFKCIQMQDVVDVQTDDNDIYV